MIKEYKIGKEIYPGDIIEQAIKDFSNVSKIKYDNEQISICGKNKEEIEEIFNEFMNYCIGLIDEK